MPTGVVPVPDISTKARFKSFAVEADEHLLGVGRYVERNALRARLVKRAEDWPWGSLWQRRRAQVEDRPQLATGPVPLPADWSQWVNAPQTAAEEAAIRRCLRRGQPFGTAAWLEKTAKSFGLQSTQRRPGRPPRASHAEQLLLFEENGS